MGGLFALYIHSLERSKGKEGSFEGFVDFTVRNIESGELRFENVNVLTEFDLAIIFASGCVCCEKQSLHFTVEEVGEFLLNNIGEEEDFCRMRENIVWGKAEE